jgi:hypothetical protein
LVRLFSAAIEISDFSEYARSSEMMLLEFAGSITRVTMDSTVADITKVVVLYKGHAQPEIHDEGC